MRLTIQEICEATGGTLYGGNDGFSAVIVKAVSTDSRADVTGCLFIPIKGPAFDGHDYIETAFSKGAICTLSEREVQNESFPQIKVSSTRQALIDLAVYDRNRFKGPVLAITGSAGKTTTKEMLASVMSQKFKTLKTLGNFNNDIGLPLSLLSREEDHELMVLEMGMNHLGEISVLSRIGRPDICMITNIGDAHIENLGSREGILRAKSEIFEGMREGGTVILNGDDPLLAGLPIVPHAGKTIYCHLRHNKPPATIQDEGNWIAADYIDRQGLQGTICTVMWNIEGIKNTFAGSMMDMSKGSTSIEIPLPGDYMIMNALMAFAAGLETGLNIDQICEGIKNFTPAGNRMAISEVNGMIIINDTYNASPPSMKAAIDMLAGDLKNTGRRKVCILGDMLELGDHAEVMHREVGQYAAGKGIDMLISIGPLSKFSCEAFKEAAPHSEARHFMSYEFFIAKWRSLLTEGDTVLVKASRGMALEHVVKSLMSDRS